MTFLTFTMILLTDYLYNGIIAYYARLSCKKGFTILFSGILWRIIFPMRSKSRLVFTRRLRLSIFVRRKLRLLRLEVAAQPLLKASHAAMLLRLNRHTPLPVADDSITCQPSICKIQMPCRQFLLTNWTDSHIVGAEAAMLPVWEHCNKLGWMRDRVNARTIRHFQWVSRPAAGSKGCGPCGGRYNFRTKKTLSLGVAADNQQKTL